MELRINQLLFIMSKKDYATGERTFESLVINNEQMSVQLILTFKDKNDPTKDLLKLSESYDLILSPVKKGED